MFGDAYIGVISAVLTFLILVVSEIIPKTLGAAYWRRLTPFVAASLEITTILMWPLVKMAEFLTRLMTRNRPKKSVHRDEFIALAESLLHQKGMSFSSDIFNHFDTNHDNVISREELVDMIVELAL